MYTRCTACHTVHPVNAALLARSGGKYRCGKCNKAGNALESLFDEWPEPGDRPTVPGALPVLGASIDLEQAAQSRQTPDEADPSSEEGIEAPDAGSSGSKLLRAFWIVAALVIAGFAVIELADFYEKPLLDQSGMETAIIRLGLKEAPPSEPFRDLDQIHLVSRELRSHPTQPDRLRLSATIVNRAKKIQSFPSLEIILFDAAGQPLNRQRFEPSDYLAEGTLPGAGMAPQAYLPLTLDLEDPGLQAVGFELEFH